ncbi:MAG: cysteine synthase B, partial [Nitrospirae bacterium GWD2_57_9]
MGVLDSIGNTPLVRLESLNANPRVTVLAKLEGNNPGGSVKDRIALCMIRDAEEKRLIKNGDTILEATSGNTGIGLAMVGAALGYKVLLTMPECVSMERRKILEAFGAELILSPGNQGTDGAIKLARKMTEENPGRYFMPNQFDNPANVRAHYENTGKEIIKQTKGEIDVFVAGMGTTGTLMGVGKRLREFKTDIRIVGVEPVLGHKIQGLKNMQESIVPKIFHRPFPDEILSVNDEEAFTTTRHLALREGIFAGMSSGAAVFGALTLAKRMDRGTVVVILPDR